MVTVATTDADRSQFIFARAAKKKPGLIAQAGLILFST
jgi:hypothetical protein